MKRIVAVAVAVVMTVLSQTGFSAEASFFSPKTIYQDEKIMVNILPTTQFVDGMRVETYVGAIVKELYKLCGDPLGEQKITLLIGERQSPLASGEANFLTSFLVVGPNTGPYTLVHELFHFWHRPITMPESFMDGMALAVSYIIGERLKFGKCPFPLADWRLFNKSQLAGSEISSEPDLASWRCIAWGGFWLYWMKTRPDFLRNFFTILRENNFPLGRLNIKDRGVCELFCEQATPGFEKFAKSQPIYGPIRYGPQILVAVEDKHLKILVFERDQKTGRLVLFPAVVLVKVRYYTKEIGEMKIKILPASFGLFQIRRPIVKWRRVDLQASLADNPMVRDRLYLD